MILESERQAAETSVDFPELGGIDKDHPNGIDNRTDAQKAELRRVLTELHKKYPYAKIMGHRDISPDKNHNGKIDPSEFIKLCPCFSAMEEYKDIQNMKV